MTGVHEHTADPSALTTQALLREIESLEKLMSQRMDAIEKAVTVAHENLVRVPTDVDKAIAHLKELHEEKFRSIQVQFEERDVRVEHTSRDSKVAVDAALQAAKEAVGEQNKSSGLAIAKSEAATGKQIDQLGLLIQQNTKATDDKISDLKERLTRFEGMGKGRVDMWAYIVGGVGIISALVAILWR